MKIEAISIFPEYFSPLSLSLIGKAQDTGLLTFAAHDLRDFTHDPHRTVDDTPYGGGAGMVLKPEPIGEAIDALLSDPMPITLIIPTPSGRRFDQRAAEELATHARLVFLCGRYEGIDGRVAEHFLSPQYKDVLEVREYSLGDYVLNGGEVAALAMIEAITRLLPGVIGNPESLTEESHVDGLLEYPVYTKPEQWRGLTVPEVLRSGNHAAIRAWRAQTARERTAQQRPDLLDPEAK